MTIKDKYIKTNQGHIHKILDEMILINKMNRCLHDTHKYNITPIQYAVEFCTIKFDIGRCAGKTEFIKNRVNSNDLIVTRDNQSKQNMKELANYVQIFVVGNSYDKLRGVRFDTIYIDDVSLLQIKDLDTLYSILVRDYNHTFVLLG